MKNDISFPKRLVAFIGYLIPVIGWWIPLYLAPNDETLQFHGKQSFIITVTSIFNVIIFYLISRIIPIQFDVVVDVAWVVLLTVYAALILISALKALISKNANLYLFGKIAKQLPL